MNVVVLPDGEEVGSLFAYATGTYKISLQTERRFGTCTTYVNYVPVGIIYHTPQYDTYRYGVSRLCTYRYRYLYASE
jgi:hypothetical protein